MMGKEKKSAKASVGPWPGQIHSTKVRRRGVRGRKTGKRVLRPRGRENAHVPNGVNV